MNSDSQISSLTVGPVSLNVNDLSLMKGFYNKIIGLDILAQNKDNASLGKENKELITLQQKPNLPQPSPDEAGLYHFAILYSSRHELAKTVERILHHAPQHFSGSGDHLVSEAFYFYDPEGNGIELYFDRDRSEWQYENNQIKMATLYIDPMKYIQSNLVLEDGKTDVQIGHIHLKVGDISKAKNFYVNILGFDVTAELPGALFISVGGYHHHIGLNTWESYQAEERYDSLGLHSFELVIPEQKEVDELTRRLNAHNIKYTKQNNYIVFFDPWKNQIKITADKADKDENTNQ